MLVDGQCSGRDVTLDTNVLVHSVSPKDARQTDSLAVMNWLRNCSGETRWVLDDQGKTAPDPKTSVLYKEYRDRLQPQSAPLVLLSAFLQGGRVRFAPRPDAQTRKKLRTLVPRNIADQAVLGAAAASQSRLLVSNDYSDFPDKVRRAAKKELGVTVVNCQEAVA